MCPFRIPTTKVYYTQISLIILFLSLSVIIFCQLTPLMTLNVISCVKAPIYKDTGWLVHFNTGSPVYFTSLSDMETTKAGHKKKIVKFLNWVVGILCNSQKISKVKKKVSP